MSSRILRVPVKHLLVVCCAALWLGCDAEAGTDTATGADTVTDAGTDTAAGTDTVADTAAGTDAVSDTAAGTDTAADTAADAGPDTAADTAGPDDTTTNPSPPAPPGYSGAVCPELAVGANTFLSAGMSRKVQIWMPPSPAGAGVVFLWHGFGDTGVNFGNAMQAGQIAKQFGVIIVSAEAALDPLASDKLAEFKDLAAQFIGPMPPTWSLFDGPGVDLQLFDDLLSCLDEEYAIDRTRVHTMGFSAGALWSTILVLERSEWLASAVLWSGGLGSTGGLFEIVYTPYTTPGRDIPVLAATGGATDLWPNAQFALVDFVEGSDELTADLTADGHDVIRCDHGLGHTIPSDGLTWGLQFLLDHHWRPEGGTLYKSIDGLGYPPYCSLELGQH